MAENAAPGWYPVQGGQRYWDGQKWTDHIAPSAQVVVGRDPFETNHILHLLLTVFTLGLWAPVWFFIAWSNANKRTKRLLAESRSG